MKEKDKQQKTKEAAMKEILCDLHTVPVDWISIKSNVWNKKEMSIIIAPILEGESSCWTAVMSWNLQSFSKENPSIFFLHDSYEDSKDWRCGKVINEITIVFLFISNSFMHLMSCPNNKSLSKRRECTLAFDRIFLKKARP